MFPRDWVFEFLDGHKPPNKALSAHLRNPAASQGISLEHCNNFLCLSPPKAFCFHVLPVTFSEKTKPIRHPALILWPIYKSAYPELLWVRFVLLARTKPFPPIFTLIIPSPLPFSHSLDWLSYFQLLDAEAFPGCLWPSLRFNSVFLEGFILSRDFIASYMIMTQIFIAVPLVLPPNSRFAYPTVFEDPSLVILEIKPFHPQHTSSSPTPYFLPDFLF